MTIGSDSIGRLSVGQSARQQTALTPAPIIATAPVVDSNAILNRVKQLIPKGWFKWTAPLRDAVLGGLSDSAAWSYGLIVYARAQTRLATAYGIWLDVFSFDFLGRFLIRNGSPDDAFRALIRATILQERVTRKGMISALTTFTGNVPIIFEPWNTGDTGAYSSSSPTGFKCGQFGYNVGNGGYGSMILPGQTFIEIKPGGGAGVPDVGGYGSNVDGYGNGSIEWVGIGTEQSGITNAMILALISNTKPTGTICWVSFISFYAVFSQSIYSNSVYDETLRIH